MASDMGQWGTVTFTIPDFLEKTRESINTFAELLVTYLEVANLTLEFVKTFVRGFLDPLAVLIEAIVAEILAFLRDLRQIGIYITGDWALLGWPPEELRGGYQGFERRMIARLTDQTDPTRPDIPSTTKVLGFFAYLDVDPSDFERLVNFLLTLMKMFGISFFPDSSRLPIPVIQGVKYGGSGANLLTFDFASMADTLGSFDGSPPDKTRITWVAQPAAMKHPLNPFPQLGPSGYVITVSTRPEGIPLKFARVRATTDKKLADGIPGKAAQPREYGVVRDTNGQPVLLYGGAEMLSFKGSDFEYNKAITGGVPKDGYCQVFGTQDPASDEVIPLEDLGPSSPSIGSPGDGKGSSYFLQRSFLITDGVTLAQWFAGEYNAVLGLNDMPHRAHWERQSDGTYKRFDDGVGSTYYVRVMSAGKQVADEKQVPKWDFFAPRYQAFTSGDPFVVDLKSGTASLSAPSEARKVTFVGANTQEYLKALQQALLILVLSRADLPLLAEIETTKGAEAAAKYMDGVWAAQGFAVAATGLEGARGVLSRLYPDPHSLETPQSPLAWRTQLFNRIRSLSLDLYEKSGTNARIEQVVVDQTVELRALTAGQVLGALVGTLTQWSWEDVLHAHGVPEDPILFETLNPDNPISGITDWGLAPNLYSTGMSAADVDDLFYLPSSMSGRDPDFVMFNAGKFPLVLEEPDAKQVALLLAAAPEGLRRLYEKFIQDDGSLLVPNEYRTYLTDKKNQTRYTSSGDSTPVFVVGRDTLVGLDKTSTYYSENHNFWPGLAFTRGLLRAWPGIYEQAALVLKVACTDRAPADGEWIALRLFDAMPALEDFLRAIENWVQALAEAVRSVADAIVKYIEFLQAQIVELQQLIRRINAIIQSFLNFTYALPQFSGLLLESDGTYGILTDLVTSENKPSDSPLSYGAGIAMVIPYAPSFILDIIGVLKGADGQPTQNLDATTSVGRPPDAVGTEGVEPTPGAPPTDEPDVL